MPVLFVCSLSFICGVFLSTCMSASQVSSVFTSLALGLIFLLLKNKKFSRFQIVLYLSTFIFAVGTAVMPLAEKSLDDIAHDFRTPCTMHGRITDIQASGSDGLRATVKLFKIKNSDSSITTDKQVYLYTTAGQLAGASVGDDIIFTGKITQPDESMNFGSFNLRRYFLSINIAGTVNTPASVRTFGGNFYPPGIINNIKNYVVSSVKLYTSEENSGFITAVLIGDRSGFTRQLTENTRKTGISHVTAVSGMHVSILISFILIITKPFSKRRRTKARIVIPVLLLYVILSGFSPSVIRAVVMGCCCMWGILTGKRTNTLYLLIPCCAVMLAINPFLLYNPSFVLSFLSSLGLAVFMPVIKQYCKSSSLLTDTAVMTLVANISTLPYVLCNFEFYSWMGLFSNLLIVPLISFVFIGGALTVIFSFISPLAHIIGSFTDGVSSLILKVSDFIANQPFGRVSFHIGNLFYVLALYLFIILLYFMLRKNRKLTLIFFIFSVLAFGSGFVRDYVERNSFSVTYIYVGQGDSTAINIPDDGVYLIDTGDISASGYSHSLEYLQNSGVRKIRGIILSHSDSDHSGALTSIISQIPTTAVFVSANTLSSDSMNEILKSAHAYGCKVIPVSAGDVLKTKNSSFRFLHPDANSIYHSANSNSLVVDLNYKGKSFLFTGDIDTNAEQLIIPLLNACDVLKVAHHGSSDSTSDRFISRISPEYAVISASSENPYSHPAISTLKRLQVNGAKTFLTFKSGAVRFYVSGNGTLTYKTKNNIY